MYCNYRSAIVTSGRAVEGSPNRSTYRNYNVLADYCRPTPVHEPIWGGVLIFVDTTFSAEEMLRIDRLSLGIEH